MIIHNKWGWFIPTVAILAESTIKMHNCQALIIMYPRSMQISRVNMIACWLSIFLAGTDARNLMRIWWLLQTVYTKTTHWCLLGSKALWKWQLLYEYLANENASLQHAVTMSADEHIKGSEANNMFGAEKWEKPYKSNILNISLFYIGSMHLLFFCFWKCIIYLLIFFLC